MIPAFEDPATWILKEANLPENVTPENSRLEDAEERHRISRVFARGLTERLFTRAYLPHDLDALAADPLLSSLDEADRETLTTREDEHGYVFDVRLQGERETVFLSHRRP